MRTKFCGFLVAATLTVGLLALPVISAGQDSEETGSLDDLLKQRRDVLRQVVEVVTTQYHNGTKSFDVVVQAKGRLIDAELELVNSRQERLSLLRQQVEMFETFSAAIEERFALGVVTQPERLAAQVAILDAKTELAREQVEDNEAGK